MQGFSPRYAIYFTPPPQSALAQFGASILGYDPFARVDVARAALENISSKELAGATETPRRYGFHATLVAPFHLKSGTEDQLFEALDRFSGQFDPVSLGKLQVSVLKDFVALTPTAAIPKLDQLACRAVEFFDVFRAALRSEEIARRNNGRLSPRQRTHLDRWGYPYIFEDFRFHMSLTGPLPVADHDRFLAAFTEAARPIIGIAYGIDALSLLRQKGSASKFEILGRRALSRSR